MIVQHYSPKLDISIFDRLRRKHVVVYESNAFFEMLWDGNVFRV